MSKTLEKAIQLFDLFTNEKPTWTMDEISEYTKIPKPTVYRLLKIFVENGFLQKTPFDKSEQSSEGYRFSLGLKFLELGNIVSANLDVRNIALPHMKSLQLVFNEAVQLAFKDGHEGIYVEKVESTRPVRLYTRTGRRAPLYAGACMRTILAFQSKEEIDQILSEPLTNYASGTPKTKEEVYRLLECCRKEGYSYSVSELEEGTVSIAVPVFNHEGKVLYSLSIAGIITSIPEKDRKYFVQELWNAAAIISSLIGYKQPYPYGVL
ncbi:IclR family transcriptional regulator [Lysinibacillus telephonicus]|uniref:IclR family transcriptional regulator n=1 Tax=Lysinibacillus telephonicus TaxID=1714840 RepID=UPI0031FD9E25